MQGVKPRIDRRSLHNVTERSLYQRHHPVRGEWLQEGCWNITSAWQWHEDAAARQGGYSIVYLAWVSSRVQQMVVGAKTS
jgi:hypothetical protein